MLSNQLYKHQTNSRVILGHSVQDVITQTCKRNGLFKDQLHFDLSHTYPIHPLTTQAAETDWAFISRLATREGFYFYSIVKDDREVIVFTDHNARCPYIAREVLNFIAPSGANETVLGQALVGVHHLGANVRMVIPQSRVHDYNENTPSTNLLASTAIEPTPSLKPTPQPGETVFGLGTRSLDETDRRSRLIAERAAVEAFDLTAHGNVVDMAAGHICSLNASTFSRGFDEYSGDYFITKVTHKASQFAGHDEGDEDIAYRNTATCIKRETPYRSKTLPHPDIPTTMTARVESDGPYAHLDEQGQCKTRAVSDLSNTQHTQAMPSMRRIAPYGGLPNESNVGWHTPLQDGDEVLISCLNGDPDRPMIVGTVPNPDRVSPVTQQNRSVNRLRTKSDNELTFDDTQQKEAITMRTYEGFNILHLDATELANKVRLASEHGAMVTFAKKTIHRQSDDTMTERVGNDRLVKVKNKSRTETQTKEIQHQAKTDHEHAAHNNVQLEAAKNIELQSGRHTIIDVEDNVKITIKGADGQFTTVRNGDVTIQSAKSIDITGQGGGDITFEQNGGGFKIDTAGVVSFYGKKIFFGGAGGVQLNGKVNYSVPGPNPPGPVSTTAPMAFAGIDLLIDEAKEHSLESSLPFEQLKGLAKFMSDIQFLTWMPSLFGFDLPISAYEKLREDLLNNKDIQPEIIVVHGVISGTSAVYDKRNQTIYVSETAIENAINDKDAAWKLHIMLTEEFGHHIDNVLRTEYSDVGGDAYFDEGARYAFAIINYKFDLQSTLTYADYTGTFGGQSLSVTYPNANAAVKKHLSASARYDQDSESAIEKFGDGRGTGHLSFGHQSIEDVLKEAFFTDEDRLMIYFGNWLRDYSQICDAKIVRMPGAPAITLDFTYWDLITGNGHKKIASEVSREMNYGLFSRKALTDVVNIMAQGEFVDSHLDGDKLEKQKKIFKVDETLLGVYRPEEHIDNPLGIGDATHKDSQFRGPVLDEELEIDPATHMKTYIATPGAGIWISSIEYIEQQITLAVKHGKTPVGMRHFGAALHTLEDFFAHSNFIEITINKLFKQNKLALKDTKGKPITQIVSWAPKDPKTGITPLVTGKFGGLDTAASILLKVGAGMAAADVCTAGIRTPATHNAITLLKDIDKKWGNTADSNLTGFKDWQKENEFLATASCKMMSFLFGWIGEFIGATVLLIAEQIDDLQTAYIEDPNSSDPTHSQLAKDHGEHIFHTVAAELAMISVLQVGKKMQSAFDGDASTLSVIDEFKKFMVDPVKSTWMDNLVIDWSHKNRDSIIKATDKGWLAKQAKEHSHEIKREAENLIGNSQDVIDYYKQLEAKK